MQAANYLISSCSGDTTGVVDFGAHIPSIGEVYSIVFVDNVLPVGCYTVDSIDSDAIAVVSEFQKFESCDECVNGVPVNTFYEYTNECCDYLSGSTGQGKPYPHPKYASGLGVAIQMNAVTIGGFDGLNN